MIRFLIILFVLAFATVRAGAEADSGQADESLADLLQAIFDGGAIHRLREAAESGDGEACYRLARKFETGDGLTKPDPEAALRWATAGVAATNTACMNLLGSYHLEGLGVLPDPVVAATLFRQAADLGDPKGALNFSLACEMGNGVEKDESKAFRYAFLSARNGLPEGMTRTGLCLLYGTGAERNAALAAEWFANAAEAGDSQGAGFLGRCLVRGIGLSNPVPDKALPWLRMAVAAGHVEFARDFETAILACGPEPSRREELASLLAREAESTSADASSAALACGRLADILVDPSWGEPDPERARGWMERGAPLSEASFPRACQRIERASFDAAAVRAAADAEAVASHDVSPSFAGVRLGMPLGTAARLLEAALSKGGLEYELFVLPEAQGPGVRGVGNDDVRAIGGSAPGAPLRALYLSRAARDAVFGTKNLPAEAAEAMIRVATGVSGLGNTGEETRQVEFGGLTCGTQRVRVLRGEGWELLFYGPLAVVGAENLSDALDAGAFRPAGSVGLRRTP